VRSRTLKTELRPKSEEEEKEEEERRRKGRRGGVGPSSSLLRLQACRASLSAIRARSADGLWLAVSRPPLLSAWRSGVAGRRGERMDREGSSQKHDVGCQGRLRGIREQRLRPGLPRT